MPVSNPFTAIDNIVASAITGHTLFANLNISGRIQVFDRPIDIRGEIEASADMGKRIWIEPVSSDPRWNFSSGSTQFVEQYRVGFGNGDMKLEEIRQLKWDILQALATLSNLKNPDGTPLDGTATTPLDIQSITIGGSRPERDPLSDPQEWLDEILVTVTAFASTNSMDLSQ